MGFLHKLRNFLFGFGWAYIWWEYTCDSTACYYYHFNKLSFMGLFVQVFMDSSVLSLNLTAVTQMLAMQMRTLYFTTLHLESAPAVNVMLLRSLLMQESTLRLKIMKASSP